MGILGILAIGLGIFGIFGGIPKFELLGITLNWVTAACLVVVIFVVIKYGSKNKQMTFALLIGLLVIVSSTAVTSFLRVNDDIHKRSAMYGKSELVDIYENFTAYDIKLDDVVFYKNSNGEYVYTKDIKKAFDFDGTANKYNMLVNSTPCDYTMSGGGLVQGHFELSIQRLNGTPVSTIMLDIYISFLKTKTKIEIISNANSVSYGYLRQYAEAEGMKLRLIDEQYNSQLPESESSTGWQTMFSGSYLLKPNNVNATGYSVDMTTLMGQTTFGREVRVYCSFALGSGSPTQKQFRFTEMLESQFLWRQTFTAGAGGGQNEFYLERSGDILKTTSDPLVIRNPSFATSWNLTITQIDVLF